MKPLAEHINLPLYTNDKLGHTGICDFFGGVVFTIGGGENADKDRAAAIVTALNAYPEVIKALLQAKFALETMRNLTGRTSITPYVEMVENALKLAGEA